MEAFYLKLLDYGILGIAVFILGFVVYRISIYIISRMEASQAKCEKKLEEKDTVIIAISEKCFKAIDENTRATKELVTEIRHRRASDPTPRGNRL